MKKKVLADRYLKMFKSYRFRGDFIDGWYKRCVCCRQAC